MRPDIAQNVLREEGLINLLKLVAQNANSVYVKNASHGDLKNGAETFTF